MRERFSTPPGTDLVGIGNQTGQTRGIIIDNASGSWLTLYPTNDAIPPYTLGWARNFDTLVQGIDVRFTVGPSGQLSSIIGDPLVVWLDTVAVVPSTGALFVTTQDQPNRVVVEGPQLWTPAGTTIDLTPGLSPLQRVRLFSVGFFYRVVAGNRQPWVVQLQVRTFNLIGPTTWAVLWVGPNRPVDYVHFANPIDCPIGEQLRVIGSVQSTNPGDNSTIDYLVDYGII